MSKSIRPVRSNVYSTSTIMTDLSLKDQPFLQFDIPGLSGSHVIQSAECSEEDLAGAPGFSDLEWTYVLTTDEWIPVFRFNGEFTELRKHLHIEPQLYSGGRYSDNEDDTWVVPAWVRRRPQFYAIHRGSLEEVVRVGQYDNPEGQDQQMAKAGFIFKVEARDVGGQPNLASRQLVLYFNERNAAETFRDTGYYNDGYYMTVEDTVLTELVDGETRSLNWRDWKTMVRGYWPTAKFVTEDGSGKTYGDVGEVTAVRGPDMQADVVGVFTDTLATVFIDGDFQEFDVAPYPARYNIETMLTLWNEGADEADHAFSPTDLFGEKTADVEDKVTDADWVLNNSEYDPTDLPSWVEELGVAYSPDGNQLAVVVTDGMIGSYFLFDKKA